MTRPGTATIWVAVSFEDEDGLHEAGTQYDYPVKTESQRASFAALMSRGVLSESETKARPRSGTVEDAPSPTKG